MFSKIRRAFESERLRETLFRAQKLFEIRRVAIPASTFDERKGQRAGGKRRIEGE
jgi:hypothetical protein